MDRFDHIFKGAVAFSGTAITYLFGGWSVLLETLVVFVIIDYLTGLLASGTEGKLNSAVGFKGIPRKIMVFVMVAVAHFVDNALGEGHLFRNAVIFFYMANELLSIIENAGRVGLPVPEQLKNAVDVLKGRSKRNDDKSA